MPAQVMLHGLVLALYAALGYAIARHLLKRRILK
jgi:hypothetical protein